MKFKIDDKVLVWNNGNLRKIRGHFAGINSNGRPTIWHGGATSYTSINNNPSIDSRRLPWENCELYEEES